MVWQAASRGPGCATRTLGSKGPSASPCVAPPAHARTRTRGPLASTAVVSNNFRVVSEHPRCAALLHGGKRCRSVVVTGTEFCPHHSAVAAEHGAEVVKRGEHLPVRRKRIVQAPVVAEVVPVEGNGGGRRRSRVRPSASCSGCRRESRRPPASAARDRDRCEQAAVGDGRLQALRPRRPLRDHRPRQQGQARRGASAAARGARQARSG